MNLPQVKALLATASAPPQESSQRSAPAKSEVGAQPGANPSTRMPSLEVVSSGQTGTDAGEKAAATDAAALLPHYVASRPYRRFPVEKLTHSLTAKTLRGPGRFAVPPLILSKTAHGAKEEGGSVGDAYAFMHLGASMCGHQGLVHGGLLATVCDEALARTAFFSLPSHVGVTARLELDYRQPTKSDQFVVVQTQIVPEETRGRKAVVKGKITDLEGNVLVEARAVFVEPKFARFLDTSLVKDAMDTE